MKSFEMRVMQIIILGLIVAVVNLSNKLDKQKNVKVASSDKDKMSIICKNNQVVVTYKNQKDIMKDNYGNEISCTKVTSSIDESGRTAFVIHY